MANNRETINKVNRLTSTGDWQVYNIGAEAQDIIGRNGDYSRESVQSVIFKNMAPKVYNYGDKIYNAQEHMYETLTWENIQKWLDEGRIKEFLKEGDCIIVPAIRRPNSVDSNLFHFWVIGINTHNGQTSSELNGTNGRSLPLEHIDFCGGSYRLLLKGTDNTSQDFLDIEHNNGKLYNLEAYSHFWEQAGGVVNGKYGMFNKILNTSTYSVDNIEDNNFLAVSGLQKTKPTSSSIGTYYIVPKTLYLGKRKIETPVFNEIARCFFLVGTESAITSSQDEPYNNLIERLRNIMAYYYNITGNNPLIERFQELNYRNALMLDFLIKMNFDVKKFLETVYSAYCNSAETFNNFYPTSFWNNLYTAVEDETSSFYQNNAAGNAAYSLLWYSVDLTKDSILDGFEKFNNSQIQSEWPQAFLAHSGDNGGLPSMKELYQASRKRPYVVIPNAVISILENAKNSNKTLIQLKASDDWNTAINLMLNQQFAFSISDPLNTAFINFFYEDSTDDQQTSIIYQWFKTDSVKTNIRKNIMPKIAELSNYFYKAEVVRFSPFSEGQTILPNPDKITDTTTYLWSLTEYELFGQNSFGNPRCECGQSFQYPSLRKPEMRKNICKDLHNLGGTSVRYLATLTTTEGSPYEVAGMSSEDLVPISVDICGHSEGSELVDMPICFRMQQQP